MHWKRTRVDPWFDDPRPYLAERMPHTWTPRTKACKSYKCTACGAVKMARGWTEQTPCPKRRKPNRWLLHFRRWKAAQLREPDTRPLDVRLMDEIRSLERQAKHLPQDMATWAYHPVARRYRRIVRRLWTMPLSREAAEKSPTRDRLLTRKGQPAEPNAFPEKTRVRKALQRLEAAIWRDGGEAALPDLARKAATALRAVRPDLFEETPHAPA